MADYPLKQEAEEVQNILDSSLTFNNKYPQALSEEEKAFTREKIGASAVGEGIKILSHFDMLEELTAAITSPKAGDAYSVGTELPYNLYIYDFIRGGWRNYGPIRANDIKARFAQNIPVPVSTWLEDTSVFVDYSFRARIALAEVSGNDFPIVAFSPSDAIGGNLCPIAYCFDGFVEIWAKSIPAEAITIPAVTFIIQDTADSVTGNSTKGITNASGGIATGGIGTEQIANRSVTRAKLAQDALWNAPKYLTVPNYTLTLDDLGRLLMFGSSVGNVDLTINVPDSVALNAPLGANFAVYNRRGTSLTVKFGSNTYSVTKGADGFYLGKSYKMNEKYDRAAFEKIDTSTTRGYWDVIGDVEVVS